MRIHEVSLGETHLSSQAQPCGFAALYPARMHTFGARLRAARNNLGWSQQRLGDEIGVSKGAISRWESDQDQPQFSFLVPLRTALRVSLDELVCGDSVRRPGVAEDGRPYDLPNEEEWTVLRALRRMTLGQRRGLIAFIDPERRGK